MVKLNLLVLVLVHLNNHISLCGFALRRNTLPLQPESFHSLVVGLCITRVNVDLNGDVAAGKD